MRKQSDRKTKMPQAVIDLGKNIEKIIKDKGLKVSDVAHDSNMDTENFRAYLKGRVEMKVSTLVRIADALQVDMNSLFPKSK